MSKEQLQEIRQLAFYQAAYNRLFYVKGEVSKIDAELSVHHTQLAEIADIDPSDTAAVRNVIKSSVEAEYLKTLKKAYLEEIENLFKMIEKPL